MFSWLQLTLVSGILLGFWDISKKKALQLSPLYSVLAIYTTICFAFSLYSIKESFNIPKTLIILILIKSIFVVCSWIFNFIAIKNLPISVITPFNTLIPIFTIIISTIFLHEKISLLKAVGIAIILTSYYFINKTVKSEGHNIFKNKYFLLIFFSTFFAALSAILDKIILRNTTPVKIQFWFCFFLATIYWIIFIFVSFKSKKETKKPHFNVYIVLMSILLFLSDRIYFTAINDKDSIISIIMPVRSVSIIVSSIVGGFIFKEKNLKKKLICTIFIILGIALIFS